jgi:hypothetical protein
MPVQTSYSATLSPGFPGLTFESARNTDTAATQSEASAEVPFGVFVARAATPDALLRPRLLQLAASGDAILGATLHSHAYNRETDLGATGVKPQVVMDVRVAGTLWMLCEEDMAVTDAVYARYATGAGGSTRGALRNDADTASARLVKGARLLTPTYNVTLLGQTYKTALVEFDAMIIALP